SDWVLLSSRTLASWRNSSVSVSRILVMSSEEWDRRRAISSSSRRISRRASSSERRASGPEMVMTSPPRHGAAEDRHGIVDVEKAVLLETHRIALDDAVVALVGLDGAVD